VDDFFVFIVYSIVGCQGFRIGFKNGNSTLCKRSKSSIKAMHPKSLLVSVDIFLAKCGIVSEKKTFVKKNFLGSKFKTKKTSIGEEKSTANIWAQAKDRPWLT
jgi:hypothetical protein